MKIISVKLPDALDVKVAAMARQRGTSKSEVVRSALEALVKGMGDETAGSAHALAKDLAGCLAGPGYLSFNKRYFKDFGR